MIFCFFDIGDFFYGWGSITYFVERKILGYIHIPMDINKVGFVVLIQPFRDAIILFTREQYIRFFSNYLIYYNSHILFYMFGCWLLI